jgi:hypothetical protein
MSKNTINRNTGDGGRASLPESNSSSTPEFYDCTSVAAADSPTNQLRQEAQRVSPSPVQESPAPPASNRALPLPPIEMQQPNLASSVEAGQKPAPLPEAWRPSGGPSGRNKPRCPPCTRRSFNIRCIGHASCSEYKKRRFSAEQCKGLMEVPRRSGGRQRKDEGGGGKKDGGMERGELMGRIQEAA